MRVPCYSCAPGKSILANLRTSELENICKGKTQKFTPQTFANREDLLEELEKLEIKDTPSILQKV